MVAEVKTLNFYEGVVVTPPDTTQPLTIGNASASDHALAYGQLAALVLSQVLAVTGTNGSPTAVIGATGIVFSGTSIDNLKFIVSDGGAVVISANPQISVGTIIGSKLRLIFKSDSNTLELSDGTGLILNGTFVSALDRTLGLTWNGTAWAEEYRS